MNFTKTNDIALTNMSSRQGTLEASYDEIYEKLGIPSVEGSGDGKVQVEWILEFEDGTIATVYDYKQYDKNPEEVTVWSIGGFDKAAAAHVLNLFS